MVLRRPPPQDQAMKRSILITTLMAGGVAYGVEREAPDVVLVVEREAGVPSGPEQSARAQVSWIFKRAGIRLEWREAAGTNMGEVTIGIRYVSAAPAGVSAGALAWATPFGNAEAGIAVLYDRIRQVAGKAAPEAALLSYVLAHEIGHILQRTNAHFQHGIMKAQWRRRDLDEMARFTLTFTSTDLELIRDGLATLKRQRIEAPLLP